MGCSKCEAHFCTENSPKAFHPYWMKDIPNDTHLSQLTIPGTHNSCSFRGGVMAITQSWSIQMQLLAGIRYFDIRLRRYNGQLRLYHGVMNQCMGFEEVLSEFGAFLKEHPSEIVIMAVQEENTACCTEAPMTQMFTEYVKEYEEVIVQYKGKDVLIGDIRGKILFVKVFHAVVKRVANFNVQNDWVVNYPSSIKDKKRKIKRHLNKAIVDGGKNKQIYVNYLSGVSDYMLVTPSKNAYQTNSIVFRFKGRLGVVLADFPGEGLIAHLLSQNKFNASEGEEVSLLKKDDIAIYSGMQVYILNANTMKYLAVDDNKGFKCVKEKFLFTIEKCRKEECSWEQQRLSKDTQLKLDVVDDGGDEILSGEEVKLREVDGEKEVRLVVQGYERYLERRHLDVVGVQKQDTQIQGNLIDKREGFVNGDKILLYQFNEDESVSTSKEIFLYSDYIYNDSKLKVQRVIMNANIKEDGNQWLIYHV